MLIPGPRELLPADEWGVPWLLEHMQAEAITAPVVRWGSVGRSTRHGGTWVFYCDDYRFGDWTSLAARVSLTAPAAAVEPNFTHFDWSPRAEVLWGVYRRRRIGRELQGEGVRLLVDLCVPAAFHDIALLGVPRGWRAYATRGFEARAEEVQVEYELAARHASVTPLLLVYGGGKRVEAVCRELPGAVHVKAPRIEHAERCRATSEAASHATEPAENQPCRRELEAVATEAEAPAQRRAS